MKLDSVRPPGRGALLTVAAPTLAVALAGCASGGGGRPEVARQSAAVCPAAADEPGQLVNAQRAPQDPRVLETVSAGMCLSEVLQKLGPAHHFGGSGVFVFEWKSTDGRTLQVGAPGLRDKAVYVRWAGKN